MGVGDYLKEHASGLGAALMTTTDIGLSLHNRSQDAAAQRRREAFKFPPMEIDETLMFTRPKDDGSSEEHVGFRLHVIVPGFLAEEGKALEIVRFLIKSTFEASIQKHYSIKNTTEVGVHGKVGILAALDGVGIDVTNKLTAEYGGEDKQHNTFDTELELGTGTAPMAYKMICKVIVNSVQKVVDHAMNEGLANPRVLSDEEAKELSDKADVTIEDHNKAEAAAEEKKEEGDSASEASNTPPNAEGTTEDSEEDN